MRKIILLIHVSLDGFVAGLSGEMDWIKLDDELWEHVESVTAEADTALYGATTFKLMESYWPTAANKPDATEHDIEHGRWANTVEKIVFSNTETHSDWAGTRFLKGDPSEEMRKIKKQPGKNLLMLGSPTLAQEFARLGLIDEYYLNVNPVVLGAGKMLFAPGTSIKLDLVAARPLASGVVALHYKLIS